MIEVEIKKFLDGHLNVPSFFERENSMPTSYVVVERTGGRSENKLKSSTFAIQSYAPSLYEAASLNEQVKEVMELFDHVDIVSGVHLNSDYNFTDTETKEYRYQAVFDINHY
ncbi:hypothetical protein [Facklamia sp. 7083-14-GEN3]|uniref:hypothetical protein n=1 Tax=Facklamia sp. 7083-14-GEN3 TaxID=2973478 RepID=UPI00215CE494|nr:hypothetical protein [Facklamia sp. 7083-14-GEN3]MCR8969274.1 hypothetical protein [Facklamia sp. 7083-14-GEN3]